MSDELTDAQKRELGARIRALRAYADLSQRELAQRLGRDFQVILATEKAKRDATRGDLIAIAYECGFDPKDVFGDLDRPLFANRDWLAERVDQALDWLGVLILLLAPRPLSAVDDLGEALSEAAAEFERGQELERVLLEIHARKSRKGAA